MCSGRFEFVQCNLCQRLGTSSGASQCMTSYNLQKPSLKRGYHYLLAYRPDYGQSNRFDKRIRVDIHIALYFPNSNSFQNQGKSNRVDMASILIGRLLSV